MTVYGSQIKVAERLIREKGGDCVYYSAVRVPGPNDQPWRSSGRDDIEYPVKAVVLPTGVTGKGGDDYRGGESAPSGTHKAYIAGSSFPEGFLVQSDDKLLDAAGQEWKVSRGWNLAPDGASILFTLELSA